MPGVNASGNIFNLGGQAGFAPGIVHGRVGGSARLDYTARAEICHGIDLTANARALAEARARLALYLPALRGSVSALAAAGISGRLQVKPDLFDKMGFTAAIEARADAAVAASLAIAADFTEISRAAEQMLPNPYMRLFAAFLREVSIEAGVWAQASVSAMIEAHMEVLGSLAEDDHAGFVINAGHKVGWGGGEGVDVYAGIRLNNPRRWYDRSVRLVTLELVRGGRSYLDRSQWDLLEWLQFTLPVALNAAYDIGQQAAMAVLQPTDVKATTFLIGFMRGLQRTMIEKVAELGQVLLTDLISAFANRVLGMNLDQGTLGQLRDAIQSLIATIRNGEISVITFPRLATLVLDMVTVAAKESPEPWQRALTLLWTGIGAIEALSEAVGDASFSVGAIGTGPYALSDSIILLPPHGGLSAVEAEYARYFGGTVPSRLSLEQAIDYLLYGAGVQQLILDHLPTLSPLLNDLASELNITAGDVIATLLLAAFEPASTLPLYRKLRGFLQRGLDTHLSSNLVEQLEQVLPRTSDAGIYLAEVVRPSLALISVELFANLDQFVDDGATASTFLEPFRQSASLVVYQIAARNVVTLTDIFWNIVHDQLEGAFRDLARRVQGGGMNDMVAAAVGVFAPQGLAISLPTMNAATRDLLAEILFVAADCNGPQVWSSARRRQYRTLMNNVFLSIDGDANYRNAPALDKFLDELAECLAIPALDDLVELYALQLEVLAQMLSIISSRMGPALARYFMALAQEQLELVESTAAVVLNAALAAFEHADQAWRELQAEVRAIEVAARRLADQQAANLRAAQNLLSSQARRREILSRLEQDGVQNVRSAVRQIPGFDLQPRDWQRNQLAAAEATFRTGWGLLRPQVNQALQAIAGVSGSLAGLINDATSLSRLTAALANQIQREMERQLQALVTVPFVGGMSVQSIAQLAAEIVTELPVVKGTLQEALELRRQLKDTKSRLDDRKAAAQVAKDDRDKKEATRQKLLASKTLGVKISEPKPFNAAAPQPYQRQIPLNVVIAGANPSFVSNDNTQRVYLALNGIPLNLPPGAWVHNTRRGEIALATTLNPQNSPLREGINVLECGVASGTGQKARNRATFLFAN